MIIEWRIGPSSLQVAFQRCLGRFVQRNEAAFVELGMSNHQPIRSDIAKAEADRFRHPKPRTRQQAEKCTVCVPTERISMPQLGCCVQQAVNVVPRKDKGHGPEVFFATKHSRWDLMTLVLHTDVSSESDHCAKPARSLRHRSC